MPQLAQSIIHGLLIAVSLFVLWTFVSPMKRRERAIYASIAGLISALFTFLIPTLFAG